MNIKWFTKTI